MGLPPDTRNDSAGPRPPHLGLEAPQMVSPETRAASIGLDRRGVAFWLWDLLEQLRLEMLTQ